MKPSVENIPKMTQWLLTRYATSTFNVCPHGPFPNIEGPPMRIHVDPKAEPKQSVTPSKVSLHMEEELRENLNKLEQQSIIEKVPHGVVTPWCHRLVTTRKEDGTMRMTVDLSPLNKYCTREVHPMKSPYESAKGIPPNTWRTVTDARDGFHSIPLHPDDRNLTAFLTPSGRYRFLRAPQGFTSSGDGYNRRLDEITCEVERLKRCMDDNCHYDFDDDLELHWWQTIDFLELMGSHGVTLNPTKFQFCMKEIDFAGFHLSSNTIAPLPKYLDSIRTFPTPKSIVDIQAWYGLVNQVSHYAQLRNLVEPFRKFLSPSTKFYWDGELDRAFQESKHAIIDAIREGVEIFVVKRKTAALRCDWSKSGIGFYLLQKHCQCDSPYPNCCSNGWKITLCGSRFLKKAEERYAAIEREALAVAWALEQTRYFTLGCDDLVVVVDHKPLTKILGDRILDEISNPRLFRIKQRTLPWTYEMYWLPGKQNTFSDALSRHPHSQEEEENFVSLINAKTPDYADLDQADSMNLSVCTVQSNLNKVYAITWSRVQQATFDEYEELKSLIVRGFPAAKSDMDEKFSDFWNYRDGLHVYDQVIMFHDRVVIPPSLRAEVLEHIHSAHQGPTGMTHFSQPTVFWPGISNDITRESQTCKTCTRNAPSQPRQEPVPPIIPTTPFEAIVADYFELNGFGYLVVADRLSGWTECYLTKCGSEEAGSQGLIRLLKRFFGTFGVARELSNDGGSEFKADDTKDFLLRWGVDTRLSAAYNPQSNGRAELAVKSTKRLIEDNIGQNGELDTEKFLRAVLVKRNTPDPITWLSPAEVVFGHKLRDTMPRLDKLVNIFHNKTIRPSWTRAWEEKEIGLRSRYQACESRLSEHSKSLPPLQSGDRVSIQNQTGHKPNKWDRTGMVIEVRDFDKYIVKVDGSGRLTLRSRRFLKKLFIDKGLYRTTTLYTPRSTPVSTTPAKSNLMANTPINPPNEPLTVRDPPSTSTSPASTYPSSDSQEHPAAEPPVPIQEEQDVTPPNPSVALPVSEDQAHTDGSSNQTGNNVTPLRRTSRTVKQRLLYDAEKGKYVSPNSGGEDDVCSVRWGHTWV